jgi:hypothetical protein
VPDDGGVELKDGTHEVVVFVGPREMPSTIDRTLSTTRALVDQFKGEKLSHRQKEIADEIISRGDVTAEGYGDQLDRAVGARSSR